VTSRALVVSLVNRWGLQATGVDYPTTGTMNEVAIVTTSAGKVVLRGHHRRNRRRIAFEHAVMAHARTHALPVPAAVATSNGDLVVERSGRFYSLFQHAPGEQVPRDELDEPLAAEMGRMLGRLHVVLRSFRPTSAPHAHRERDPRAVLQRIERLLACLADRDGCGEQEVWAKERLLSRAAWLRRHLDLPAVDVGGEQVVHGDYQDSLAGSLVL
jgi:Ser/Thr protein kinase RdoA (MazF antagonist)